MQMICCRHLFVDLRAILVVKKRRCLKNASAIFYPNHENFPLTFFPQNIKPSVKHLTGLGNFLFILVSINSV